MTRFRGCLPAVALRLKAFRRDTGGSIALIFALAVPAVVLIAVGAIDLHTVQSNRIKLQDVSDAAALAGANELALAIDDEAAVERARAFVEGQVSEWRAAPAVTPELSVITRSGQRIMQVALKGHTPSFFGNMLPPGGWHFRTESRAVSVGMTPLCVLISGETGSKLLNVKDEGRLAAPQCLVHSNRDILVEGGSILANQVQAVASARGVINPKPGTGGAAIADPFAAMSLRVPTGCSPTSPAKLDVKSGAHRLAPGVHCGQFQLGGSATLTLEPGDHWFKGGKLEIAENARLSGLDVVLVFDKKSSFDFKDHAVVNLDGRKTGAYAGMVLIAARDNAQDFIISSDNVESLLGVVYVPNAQFIVEGGRSNVAQDSAWTVVVARSLQLKGSPSLIINANYASSDVPVPDGVGPRGGGSQLVD